MSKTSCPTFYPDADEMWELSKFIQKIEADHNDIGICKIVPPRGWYQRSYDLSSVQIPQITPIKQIVSGRGGAFHVTAFERPTMSLRKFYENAKKNSEKHTLWVDKEREFWRAMGKQQAPLYGADMEGTLFDSTLASSGLNLQEWNFDKGLNDVLRALPYKVPGVNTPMLYVGEWRAMFPFHVEDLDLYSINYLHTGAEKSWYSIAPSRRTRFEHLAEAHYADDHRSCKEYMRHKTKIFSPIKLRDSGMKFDTVVQRAGEFVVTFPGAYHGGFNHDFNIAEATNFATPRWLELGRKATRCICRPGSVFINMDELQTIYRRKCLARKALTLGPPRTHSHEPTVLTPPEHHTHTQHTSRHVVDLTVDSHVVVEDQPADQQQILRCACGEVRPVRLHERAELSLSPSSDIRSGTSSLLRCSQCLFYVHRRCARLVADDHYSCFMCCRIDQYAAAETCIAVSERSESTGQRASSLKSLQFGSSQSSQSSVDLSVEYRIDRTPDSPAKAHRCARPLPASADPDDSNHRASSGAHKQNSGINKHHTSHHSERRSEDDKKKKRHHHRHSSAGGGDGSSCDAAIVIDDAPAAKRRKQTHHHRDEIAPVVLDLQMRDVVYVAAEGRLQCTVGTITGIEADLCRLHVRGQRKKEDQWIPLRDCRLLLG